MTYSKTNDAIVLDNISKTYIVKQEKNDTVYKYLFKESNNSSGKIHAISDISLNIPKGKMIGIIGHNASGKTTLLRIMAGITNPTKGKIVVNGKIVPFLQLGSGFQGELNAVENIKLSCSILGLKKEQIKSKTLPILQFADLGKFVTMPVKHYSAGMFARLAFSIIIHTEPDILLLDEVLAVGDIAFQKKCQDEFISLRKKGKTIVYVTHNLLEAEKLCDKLILLSGGKLSGYGNPEEITQKYRQMIKESISGEDYNLIEKISFFYREILSREPDEEGLFYYVQKVKTGKLEIEKIPELLKTSEEYTRKKQK